MSRRVTSLRIKLLIGLGSFIFFLALLEFGLRVTGVILFRSDISNELKKSRSFVGTKILCVGDSFTNGGMVKRDKTYPALLQQRLDDSAPEIDTVFEEGVRISNTKVINAGVCAMNTWELSQKLPKWIDSSNPDVIILLIGSANVFNPMKNRLFEVRVVRVFLMIFMNLYSLIVSQDTTPPADFGGPFSKPELPHTRYSDYQNYINNRQKINKPRPGDPLHTMWYHHNIGKTDEAIRHGMKALANKGADEIDIILALTHFYFETRDLSKAEDMLVNAGNKYPGSERIHEGLSYYYREFADDRRKDLRLGDAIKYYLKAIKSDTMEHYNYYWMSEIYYIQSRYDSKMIYSELKRILEANPGLAESAMFNNYLGVYRDRQREEAEVEQWIYNDLEQIVLLCKDKGIRLIVQNYPISYPMANGVLKEIADRYSLPFVDNLSVFKDLEAKKKYLFDKEHCTAEGHRIMVDNIYKVLLTQEVINP